MSPVVTLALILLLCLLCSAASFLYGRQYEHAKWTPIISERNDLAARLKLYRSNAVKVGEGVERPVKLRVVGRART